MEVSSTTLEEIPKQHYTVGFPITLESKVLEFPNARQNQQSKICIIQNDNLHLTNDVK